MHSAWDEAKRLEALHAYAILDAASTAEFEDFVQIAAHVCDAPIAVVNLIDEARQWFAAEIGLGVRETALDISICAHAILQPDVFVVPDLTKDRRFDCNPLVTGEPRLRFYGGALLETPDGLPLGTICVLDYVPRPAGLTERQAFTLRALARQVMTQLELRRALSEKEAAIAEKELLVLEAHHRVKNSLQMVQSLLALQARASTHPQAAQQLRESAVRIQTFSQMHEHLYRVGADAAVNLARYLDTLLAAQRSALAAPLQGRDITFDAADVPWPASDAPSVGLVMMELVTNALKHGAGTVAVTLRQANGETVLTVEDAGDGLVADYDPSRPGNGLGMRVVNGLLGARQGRLEIDRTRGHTCFVAVMRAIAPG